MCFSFNLAGFLRATHWWCGNRGSVGLLLAVECEQMQSWEPVQLTLGITKASGPPSMYGQTRKARWLFTDTAHELQAHTHLSVAQLLVQETGITILFLLPLSALPVWLDAPEQGVHLEEFLYKALCACP